MDNSQYIYTKFMEFIILLLNISKYTLRSK